MNEEVYIVIRPAEIGDKNFILSTWLQGNYYGNSYFRQMPQDLYFKEYGARVTSILCSPETTVAIACDEAHPEWIVGFSICQKNDLFWIYVKRDFRQKGIATLLLKDKQIAAVKATTQIGRMISERKGLIFNPL